MQQTTVECELTDNADHTKPKLKFTITANDRFIEIRPHGYGECSAEDGAGKPIVIELYAGEPRVVVFNDIDNSEAHVINLSLAKESRRCQPVEPSDVKPVDASFASLYLGWYIVTNCKYNRDHCPESIGKRFENVEQLPAYCAFVSERQHLSCCSTANLEDILKMRQAFELVSPSTALTKQCEREEYIIRQLLSERKAAAQAKPRGDSVAHAAAHAIWQLQHHHCNMSQVQTGPDA